MIQDKIISNLKKLKNKEEEYWRKNLTPEQYVMLREEGTEVPFTGKYLHNKKSGVYKCGGCGQVIFNSNTKFDSKSGWPSFYDVVDKGYVKLREDSSMGMNRTGIVCSNCEGHLGHLFKDGPNPTGLRYCVNSASLKFSPDKHK